MFTFIISRTFLNFSQKKLGSSHLILLPAVCFISSRQHLLSCSLLVLLHSIFSSLCHLKFTILDEEKTIRLRRTFLENGLASDECHQFHLLKNHFDRIGPQIRKNSEPSEESDSFLQPELFCLLNCVCEILATQSGKT